MKNRYLFLSVTLLFCLLSSSIELLSQCSPRYDADVFASVSVTSDIIYGSNVNYDGSIESLELDFYEPTGDTLAERPLIILAHGGFFAAGSKTDGDIVNLCNAYAKKGYACASISYRLGWSGFLPDSIQLGEALIRGVQDAKAAVRFFRADAAGVNNYRIDPDQIFMGGSSAGGFIAVHHAFFNDLTLAPAWAQAIVTGLGGLEGSSGTPGFSSDIKGAISYAGAIVDTAWMSGSDVSLISTHSQDDNVVPYGAGPVVFIFFPLVEVMGSSLVHEKADQLGAENAFLSFTSAGHVPHISSTAAFNSTVDFTTAFLLDQLDCGCETPTGATATVSSSTSATLAWNPVDGAVGYQLLGGPAGGPVRSRQTMASVLAINVLAPSTTYNWQVRTYCGASEGFSEPTAMQSFTTPAIREAVNGLKSDLEILAFPNPTTGEAIYLTAPAAEGTFRLYSALGELVREFSHQDQQQLQLSLEDISAGTYLLNWENHAHSATLRLVIE